MTFMRRPRVFLSYRHEEKVSGLDAEHYNASHRAWVNDFAHGLASWNVDVVWDDRLRDLFRPHSPIDPGLLPFLAEVSTLCLQVAQTFMPIITRGYLERILASTGTSGYGTVTEEWSRGIAEYVAGRAELVVIVREWPIDGYSTVPAPIESKNSWDFRFVSATSDEVEFMGDSLHGLWNIERPPVDLPFKDLISKYLKFCVQLFDLPWPGIERWDCDFRRPRLFLDHFSALLKRADGDVGSNRDLKENYEVWGPYMSKWPEGIEQPAPESPDDEKKAEDEAKKMVRSIMEAHINRYRKPFDFKDERPGGRASHGLYFGPTRLEFSYLHPLDPRRQELIGES